MTIILVLALPDWSLSFIIETDVFGIGLEVVLSQIVTPLHSLVKNVLQELKLGQYMKETLWLWYFLYKKWRHYLLGRKFTIISDQKVLKFLLEQRKVQP